MKKFLKVCVLTAGLLAAANVNAQTPASQEEELFSTAQRAFDDGFHDVAIRYLEQFLPQFPQSKKIDQARLLLGECYYFKNQFSRALEEFKAVKSTLNRDEILFWTGETYLKLSNYDAARTNYQQLLRDFPQSTYLPQAMYSLAWSYFDQKKFVQARQIFSKLLQQFSRHQLSEDAFLKIAESTYNLGEYKNAVKQFQEYLNSYPQSPHAAQIHLNIADAYYYKENFAPARVEYEKAAKLSQNPSTVLTAFTGRIWCSIKEKMYDQAQKWIKDAMDFAKAKNLPVEDLLLAQGQLLYEKGDWQGSVDTYGELIRKFPTSVHRLEAYLGRGNANFALRKFAAATEDFKFILAHHQPDFDPEVVEKAQLGLGWTQAKLGEISEAMKAFQAVVDHTQRHEIRINALAQMADVYQDSGRFDEAINMYDQILKNYSLGEPLMDYVQYRRAMAFLKTDQTRLALASFAQLQKNFPNSRYMEDINYYLGVINYKDGNWVQAADHMQQFLKALDHPSDLAPQANYILALSYLNLKQSEDALRVFQKILRLYPDDEDVAKNSDIGIAKCQFELGQNKEALKRFKLIVYKYPKTDVAQEALLWLAQYEMKNSQYDQAIESYTQLLEHFPDHPHDQVHYELGQAYEVQGAVDQALLQYKAVSSKDPALYSKVKLAIAGIFSKEFDPQKALNAYQNIVATDQEYARDAYLKMAQIYRNAQNYDEEIQTYKRALRAEPGKTEVSNAELMFSIADTYEIMDRREEAVEYYLKIPDQFPDQAVWAVKAYLRVAKIFEDRQDWEGARVTYRKIIQFKTEESKYAQERLDWLKKK